MSEKPKIRCCVCVKVILTAYPKEGILRVQCRFCGASNMIKAEKKKPYGERVAMVKK